MNPQLTIDYSKVTFATFYYKTRVFGYVRRTLPRQPTLHGQVIQDEKVKAEVLARHVEDDWIPHLRLSLSANRTLKFTGDEAKKRWKEYNTRIYKQRK
jgi:hypothetical protein